ncbi:MAG TPA: hypothetical protein VGO50_06865 [Pyrinomonadaceae bacterium]|jgi:hypothetical protein|nr:hypothetical protein [Pyrinomonadaceae bacterium]
MRLLLSFLVCLAALAAFPLAGKADFFGPPPISLREMYLKSDLIVIARTRRPGKWRMENYERGSDTEVCARRIPLDVEQITGLPSSRALMRETNWSSSCDEADTARGISKNENANRRLFFLKLLPGKTGIYEEIPQSRVAPIEGNNADKYAQRLRELDAIHHSADEITKKTAEWMVSLAEDPDTLYDGVLELRRAFDVLKQKKALPDPKDPAYRFTGILRGERGQFALALLLKPEQKERLIQVFLQMDLSYDVLNIVAGTPYVEILNQAECELVVLIANFHDRRVVARLREQLSNLPGIFSFDSTVILFSLANHFADSELSMLVGKYSMADSPDHNEIIPDLKTAYDVDGVPEEKLAAMVFPPKTFGQRKAELMARIQARCKELIDGSP